MIDSEVSHSIRLLLGSTCAYIARRIQSDKHRFAYMRAMGRCCMICSEAHSNNDLMKMRHDLVHLSSVISKFTKSGWFSGERKYYTMAVEQAIEVVDSMLTRFVRGHSSNDEAVAQSVLEGDSDGHQVFSHLERVGKTEK